MVEACSFQPNLGQVFMRVCSRRSFHLFSVCEKLSVPSCVKGTCFLHGSYGCALHSAKYGSEAHDLYFVLGFVRVGLDCCSPHTCSIFKCWCHCTGVHCLECEVLLPGVCQRAASVVLVS